MSTETAEAINPIEKIRAELAEAEALAWSNRIYHFRKGDIWGPNPPQFELLEAWKDLEKKVFTMTGSNRLGKTLLGVVISLSVMFGEWPWSGEKIEFPHKDPRKVRYVGQGWESHIKTVVEPELRKMWPACTP